MKGKFFSKDYGPVISKIRRINRNKGTQAHYHWVPGHAGIAENDVVDELAKEGARCSSLLNCKIDIKEIARKGSFQELSLRKVGHNI